MLTIIQLFGISAELLLMFIFLPSSYIRKSKLVLLPVFAAAIILVTLAGPQNSFYEIVGIVALRLAIFTVFIFYYFEFPVKQCISLAVYGCYGCKLLHTAHFKPKGTDFLFATEYINDSFAIHFSDSTADSDSRSTVEPGIRDNDPKPSRQGAGHSPSGSLPLCAL